MKGIGCKERAEGSLERNSIVYRIEPEKHSSIYKYVLIIYLEACVVNVKCIVYIQYFLSQQMKKQMEQ